MQSLLTIVEPYASPLNAQFYGLIAVSIIGAFLGFPLITKRLASNYRLAGLFGMLLGFAGLISAGAAVFTYVDGVGIKPIKFNETSMEYNNETIPYNKIDKHFIKPLPQQSRYSAQINTDTALLFVIEMRDKSLHLFSNDYYNVINLKKVMNEYAPK